MRGGDNDDDGDYDGDADHIEEEIHARLVEAGQSVQHDDLSIGLEVSARDPRESMVVTLWVLVKRLFSNFFWAAVLGKTSSS